MHRKIYVEDQLEPQLKNQKCFIKDTTDFINEIADISLPNGNKLLLFCMNVKALFVASKGKKQEKLLPMRYQKNQMLTPNLMS